MATPTIDQITKLTAERFPTFGGGRTKGQEFNPLVSALMDHEPMFAAGVDVREVVAFVLAMSRSRR